MALSFLPGINALGQSTLSTSPMAAAPVAAVSPAATAIGADSLNINRATAASLALSAGTSGTYTVLPGDTLSAIAQQKLGAATRWNELFQLNADQITDPNLIFPGQVLKLPATPAAAPITSPLPTALPVPVATGPSMSTLPRPIAAKPPVASTPAIAMPVPPAHSSTGIYWSNPDNWPRPRPIFKAPGIYTHTPIWQPRPNTNPDNREQMLRQKLALLKLQEQVVQMELELDAMIAQTATVVTPPRRYMLDVSNL
jgi:LysM repeat protein